MAALSIARAIATSATGGTTRFPSFSSSVDEQERVAYWAFTDRVESTGGGWKLVVPRTQILGPEAKRLLSEAAVGGGTARTRARFEERQQAEHLRRRVEELEDLLTAYVAQLATQPARSARRFRLLQSMCWP
jgi:hypothetical protein